MRSLSANYIWYFERKNKVGLTSAINIYLTYNHLTVLEKETCYINDFSCFTSISLVMFNLYLFFSQTMFTSCTYINGFTTMVIWIRKNWTNNWKNSSQSYIVFFNSSELFFCKLNENQLRSCSTKINTTF